MNNWVDDEFLHLSLGDVRVDKSAKKIIHRLGAQPGIPIHKLSRLPQKSIFVITSFIMEKLLQKKFYNHI